MSDIDKDIELLKEVNAGVLYFCKDEKYEEYASAISNVLKELKTYKKIAKERIKSDLRVFAYCLNELELEQRAEEVLEKLRKEVEKDE